MRYFSLRIMALVIVIPLVSAPTESLDIKNGFISSLHPINKRVTETKAIIFFNISYFFRSFFLHSKITKIGSEFNQNLKKEDLRILSFIFLKGLFKQL